MRSLMFVIPALISTLVHAEEKTLVRRAMPSATSMVHFEKGTSLVLQHQLLFKQGRSSVHDMLNDDRHQESLFQLRSDNGCEFSMSNPKKLPRMTLAKGIRWMVIENRQVAEEDSCDDVKPIGAIRKMPTADPQIQTESEDSEISLARPVAPTQGTCWQHHTVLKLKSTNLSPERELNIQCLNSIEPDLQQFRAYAPPVPTDVVRPVKGTSRSTFPSPQASSVEHGDGRVQNGRH